MCQIVPAHTSCNSFYKWTKISSLEIIIFELKNDGKKWSRIYFEIHRAPSEIPAKLPGQFGHSGQVFLHWAAAILKGLCEFFINFIQYLTICGILVVLKRVKISQNMPNILVQWDRCKGLIIQKSYVTP